jgi:hypothetical protein
VARGKITAIGDWDEGASSWVVVVETDGGEILRPLAGECLRQEPEAEAWPDEAAE